MNRARLIGLVIGGSLATIAVAVASTMLGWFGMSGNTLEGVPLGAALVVVAAVSGAVVGGATGPQVATSAHPVVWMAWLPFLAGPVGTVVLTALILAFGGDVGRAMPTFFMLLGYSFVYAIPLAIPVTFAGVLLLRALVPLRASLVAMALAAIVVPAVLLAAGSVTELAGAYRVGSAVSIPTLQDSPPVSRDRAITEARPIAADLSDDVPALIRADLYPLAAVVADECDRGLPPLIDGGCGSTAPVWAVFFAITYPDGQRDAAMVVVDGRTAEPLLWGSPFTQP